MSREERTPRQRMLRRGLPVALGSAVVLGLGIAAVDPASAGSSWKIAVLKAPAGTGSVKIDFDTGNFACFASSNFSGNVETRSTAFADQGFFIQAYGDSNCSGDVLGRGANYKFAVDEDAAVSGTTCRIIAVDTTGPDHAWLGCS